jgi:tetratricopeptide (TPR) repeat protein
MATSTVSGQGCVIDIDRPADLVGAKYALGKLADETEQTHVTEKPAHFIRALGLLYEPTDKISNQLGRYYLRGKLYAVWLKIDTKGWSPIVQRKRLKFEKNPEGMHDMYMAIDTAFTKVEELNAACADSTRNYRMGVSAIVYNQANEALNAKKYDTAIVLARRALVVNPKGAAPWNVIAAAMQGRGDTTGYKDALRHVSESTETDAAMVKVRQNAFYNLGVLTLQQAQKRSPDEQKALATEAEKDLRAFLKIKPNDAAGQAALSQALMLKGDTVESRKMNDAMMANPAQYNAATLFVAAGSMYGAGQYENAVRLYVEGLKKNPNLRDALFSLTSTYITMGKFDDAVPIVARLLAVDPSNVKTYTQAAVVWRGVVKSSSNAKLTEIATDSAILYSDLRLHSPVSVEMSPEFDTSTDSASLDGVVQNMATEAKSYQVTFEFLNAAGGVVTSTVANVADVPAKTGKPFSLNVAGKGIVAWRYKAVK